MSKQEQQSGDNSTNIQANEIIVHQGLTYSQAKEVALDVFRANFYELSSKAQDVARKRAEEITDEFLEKLQSENPSGFSKSEDPDFQHALFTVQKEYARNGDVDLGALLVDLLVDRSKQEQRNILQIVLNESLDTAPKLTNDQLAALSIIFNFRYTQHNLVGNHQLFGGNLDRYVLPFTNNLSKSNSCYQHLEYSGCGAIGMGEVKLAQLLKTNYQGLFLKGFEATEIDNRGISVGLDPRFFIPNLNDPNKYQVNGLNKAGLGPYLDSMSVEPEDKVKIMSLFDQGLMNDQEIKDKCVSIRPYMDQVFSVWESSPMKNFTLTSVGIAIAHANIKRLVGEFANLSIWIN